MDKLPLLTGPVIKNEEIYQITIAALLNMLGERVINLDKHDVHNARELLHARTLEIKVIRDMLVSNGDLEDERIKIEVTPR